MQLQHRGITEDEVTETIAAGNWKLAAMDRWECRRDFSFGKEWNGKVYATKQVRPIFVETKMEIVIVTVYAYYFKETSR